MIEFKNVSYTYQPNTQTAGSGFRIINFRRLTPGELKVVDGGFGLRQDHSDAFGQRALPADIRRQA